MDRLSPVPVVPSPLAYVLDSFTTQVDVAAKKQAEATRKQQASAV